MEPPRTGDNRNHNSGPDVGCKRVGGLFSYYDSGRFIRPAPLYIRTLERCVMACDKWISLDDAARANLRGADLSEFFRYRDRLRDEGHQWTGDAEEILTGFIWDNSEE